MPHNKLFLAADMFMEARNRFLNGTRDIDFVASILLSGAVLGMVSPLLKEQGKQTQHQIWERMANAIDQSAGVHEGTFRQNYNGLKHAGNLRKNIKASQDLTLNADLRKEASHLLDAARRDFNFVPLPKGITLLDFDDDFYDAITSMEPYV
jgi:hypothetical protein